jgi:hypothetical protein
MVGEIDRDRVVFGFLAVLGDYQLEMVAAGHAQLAAVGPTDFVESAIVMGEHAVADGHQSSHHGQAGNQGALHGFFLTG